MADEAIKRFVEELISAGVMERFRVSNCFNGFYLLDRKTGKEVCVGCGVDTLFDRKGRAREDLDSPAFLRDLERLFNDDVNETLAAYWPEEVE